MHQNLITSSFTLSLRKRGLAILSLFFFTYWVHCCATLSQSCCTGFPESVLLYRHGSEDKSEVSSRLKSKARAPDYLLREAAVDGIDVFLKDGARLRLDLLHFL